MTGELDLDRLEERARLGQTVRCDELLALIARLRAVEAAERAWSEWATTRRQAWSR